MGLIAVRLCMSLFFVLSSRLVAFLQVWLRRLLAPVVAHRADFDFDFN